MSLYVDRTRLLKDTSISKQTYLLTSSIYGVCVFSKNVIYALLDKGKKIAKFVLPPFEVWLLSATLFVFFVHTAL